MERTEYCGYLTGIAEGLNKAKGDFIYELEKIKLEMIQLSERGCVSVEEAILIFNTHISELKGENK